MIICCLEKSGLYTMLSSIAIALSWQTKAAKPKQTHPQQTQQRGLWAGGFLAKLHENINTSGCNENNLGTEHVRPLMVIISCNHLIWGNPIIIKLSRRIASYQTRQQFGLSGLAKNRDRWCDRLYCKYEERISRFHL